MRLIPVVLFLCCIIACAPKKVAVTNGQADTLMAFMKESVNPHFHNQRPREAGRLLDSIYPFVQQLNNYILTCSYLRFKGVQFGEEKKYDSARAVINESIALALKKDSTGKQVLAGKIQLIDILHEEGYNDSALKVAKEAYYEAAKIDTPGLAIICLRLSEIYMDIGDLPAVKKYLFEGFHRTSRPILKTVFANGISKYYADNDQPDSAIIFFKAMETDTSFASPHFDAVKYGNLGLLLSQTGKPEEGLPYLLKSMDISRELDQLDGESYYALGETYSKLKQYKQSAAYLDTAFSMGEQSTLTSVWKRRSRNLAAQGQYAAAYAALDSSYESYRAENDSSLAMQGRELETKYAVKAKDDEIAALAFENKANHKIHRQQQVIIIGMIVGGVLLATLGLLLWRRRKLQLQLLETSLQQRLLRSQMEPHFIFNTLSVLQSFIRNDEKEKAIRYLNKFAKLVRISLENARESFVPLKDEVLALQNYLGLQAMRFEGDFDYEIDVYEQYEEDELLIPPMLLQPFVENAILHGIRQLPRKGLIRVSIRRTQWMLHCEIEDNGNGMLPVREATPDKQSLSTIITQERLTMLSRQTRQPAHLSITDKGTLNGQGVLVKLDIPLRRTK
ncbi:histidine kinase [Chitinophaga niabensis]|uniref:histidine kinase n=1 Tax=Chitinophaga niabensis TaxID=536979 RepID=UPI0031BBB653